MPAQLSGAATMITRRDDSLPLVYSCSGCSTAAQMANFIALRLDREGMAERRCIAAVAADVPRLLEVARSGRPILALEGCPFKCVTRCLQQRDIEPDAQVVLSEHGVKKSYHAQFDEAEAEAMVARLRPIAARLYSQAAGKPTDGPKLERQCASSADFRP